MPHTKINAVIARVEHHPLGLVLILDEPKDGGQTRPHFFLRQPRSTPKVGDVLQLNGKDGVLLTGDHETHIRRYAPNGLEEIPEDEGNAHS